MRIDRLRKLAGAAAVATLATAIGLPPIATLHAADIEPPKVQLLDKFGINMANGQVTHSLNTVSIGGAMGLSDSISVHANEFNYLGYRGFDSKYHAQARNVELSTSIDFSPRNVLRVYDFSNTVDFAIYVGSTVQQSGWDLYSGYTYKSLGDERHTLVVNGSYLDWTKPDGTLVKFSRGSNPSAASDGLMTSIIYPNGFTISVAYGGISVNTNTGFQLKHFYEADNRPMDKPDNPKLINVPPYTTSAASGWSNSNPRYIRAINNAVEYCGLSAAACTLTRNWPTVTFDWPAGMPRTMYIGNSTASVIDAQGRTTKYYFRAYDLAFNGSVVVEGYTPGREFSPRLIGIAPPGSNEQFTYDYRNLFFSVNTGGFGTFDLRLQTSGVVTQATKLGLGASYDMLEPYQVGGDTINYAYGSNGVSRAYQHANVNGYPGALYYVDTDDGTIWFEGTPRNFPTRFDKYAAPVEDYEYTRSNLTRIIYNKNTPAETYIQAEYPASCTSSTRKTCNQATRIRDANGNYTSYTYHPQSGQVATITYPPNKHGVSPQTHYEYTQKSAHYYDASGNWATGSPIWLKTAERYCANSSASGGACQGSDEVVTRFEYNHNNLLMTGVTVTDQATGVTLRTCYQYDIYGNQIGKTLPNADLAQCN